jgi:hypothetical protein
MFAFNMVFQVCSIATGFDILFAQFTNAAVGGFVIKIPEHTFIFRRHFNESNIETANLAVMI